MPKLRVLSGQEVCVIMATHGFEQVRRKGSHMMMQKKMGRTTITVPVPDHADGHYQAVGATAEGV